jgi:predicted molibdopterin-dependent oxidoreductase YjgC
MNAVKTGQLTLDGQEIEFELGESLYQVATRHQKDIPTLCYDDRLESFGACRLCVVQIEGMRNPVASCTTPAAPGMVVFTSNEALDKHRKTLLEMVVSENREVEVDPLRGLASQELSELVKRYEANTGRFNGRQSGESFVEDNNPFILRDYDQCISCYRCVRVCAEQEGDYAISVMNRGFDTKITTEFEGLLKGSECTFCGQCVQTCPTGALANKKALRFENTPGETEKTRTICNYCGVGCSVDLVTRNDKIISVHPAMDGPANKGALCVKGQFAYDFVGHPERLTTPLVRKNGELVPATWDEALTRAAEGFKAVEDEHGRDAIYAIASGRTPHEACYLMGKFVRAGYGTNHIDNCSRA